MKKDKRTGLLVTLAVLAVWIYIEVEPVLSQNGGSGILSQLQNNNQQGYMNNGPSLMPQNFMDQTIRSPGDSQGMMSMPQNSLAAPRNDGMMMSPASQYQQTPTGFPGFQGNAQMQQQGQQLPFMPGQLPPQQPQSQGGFQGMIQKMFGGQQGEMQQQQQQYPYQNQPQGFMQPQMGPDPAMIHQAVGAVQQELSVAANSASQAEAYRSDALSSSDNGAKQRAASEARYYANQAQAAASRAMSKAQGIPQAMSLVGQVQAQASRAQSAADSASSAASGW